MKKFKSKADRPSTQDEQFNNIHEDDDGEDENDNDGDNFNERCQSVFNGSLKTVENLLKQSLKYETDETKKDANANKEKDKEAYEEEVKDEKDDEDTCNLLTDKLMLRIKREVGLLKMHNISKHLEGIYSQLHDWSNETASSSRLSDGLERFRRISGVVAQHHRLSAFYVLQQASALRESSKLCSILLRLFAELCEKGFCTPAELQGAGEGGEGATEFEDIEGGGMGEGQGMKDVSEEIEFEEQVLGAFYCVEAHLSYF